MAVGRDQSRLDQVEQEIRAAGGEAAAAKADLLDPAAPDLVVQTAVDKFGSLDLLLNSAGIFETAPLAEVDGAHVYRNEHALPRAWVIPPPAADAAQADAGGDWAGQLAALADQSAQAIAGGEYRARVTHYAADRIEVEARSPGIAMLVLSEIWYPGWRATVDGEEQSVEQVAGILRGVRLKGGEQQVVFVYDPVSVRWGRRLSLAAVTTMIGWGGFRLWRLRQTQSAERK